MKELWLLQPRFLQRGGSRPYRLLEHPRFRAGYDFFELRARSGNAPQDIADWWERFQFASVDERETMMLKDDGPKKKRRRRRGGKKADEQGGAEPAGTSGEESAE
jgi:poly(A) polymerase